MKRVAKSKSVSSIRIIAGDWRGSRIRVLDKEGLRPTPDRIRETLFNWLTQRVSGAQVLDCCAGAGGLGLEAASRGATHVTLVEKNRQAAAHLNTESQRLKASNVTVVTTDILDFLHSSQQKYDLVFIDPPYAEAGLRDAIMQQLLDLDLLNDECLIYLEWPGKEQMPLNHPNLTWIKQKTAGQVTYALAQCQLSR